MPKTIKLTRNIKATPEEIYIALTNPFTIELWTGLPAVMSTEPGSEFSILDGEISGQNLEFKNNSMIKQKWYFDDEKTDSIVTIRITPDKNQSEVYVEHINIPDEAYENMLEGWKDFYLGSLKTFFELKDND